MLPRQKRFIGILVTLIGVAVAVSLILASFQDNLLYYVTPSEAIAKPIPINSITKIGNQLITFPPYL